MEDGWIGEGGFDGEGNERNGVKKFANHIFKCSSRRSVSMDSRTGECKKIEIPFRTFSANNIRDV